MTDVVDGLGITCFSVLASLHFDNTSVIASELIYFSDDAGAEKQAGNGGSICSRRDGGISASPTDSWQGL